MNALSIVPLSLLALLFIQQVASIGELCESDSDCNDRNEERCQKFDACSSGNCVCRPGLKKLSNDKCSEIKKLGAACTFPVECGENAVCNISSQCVCPSTTTPNGDTHCDLAKVGESCSTKTCGYRSNCVSSVCSCTGDSEVRAGVYYRSYFGQSVDGCVHKNSKTGIAEGGRCTSGVISTSDPQLVCSAGLECRLCPEHDVGNPVNQYICLKESFSSGRIIRSSVVLLLGITMGTKLL